MTVLAHKIRLKATRKQEAYFRQACGVARFVWNWGVAEWERQSKEGEKPSGMQLKAQFNTLYKGQFPWVGDVLRDAHSQPFANLQKAYTAFFRKNARKPAFKRKGKCRDSFYVANDKLRVDYKHVVLPHIGSVRMAERLRFDGKIMGAVVSCEAGRWFISIQVDADLPKRSKTGAAVTGVDLGVNASFTCSDGSVYQSPRPLAQRLKLLASRNKALLRKNKGSKNHLKALRRLAKLHWRIKNIRNDFLHKTTASILRKSQAVVIEDLSVQEMQRSPRNGHGMRRSLAEQAFGESRRQFEYKAPLFSTELHKVDRRFPSSKRCSACGAVNRQLRRSDRVFVCPSCGHTKDRDLNAAINLEQTITTTGGSRDVKPVDRQSPAHHGMRGDGLKQEFQGAHDCAQRK